MRSSFSESRARFIQPQKLPGSFAMISSYSARASLKRPVSSAASPQRMLVVAQKPRSFFCSANSDAV